MKSEWFNLRNKKNNRTIGNKKQTGPPEAGKQDA